MLVKKLGISLGFLLVFILCLSIASNYAKPNSTLFSIQRLQEYILLSITLSPEGKISYQESLLEKRLSDIEFVTMNRHYRYVLPTNLRYVTTAGKLTNYVLSMNLSKEKEQVKSLLVAHKKKLHAISRNYVEENSGDDQWRYYTDSQNYLDTYLKQLE